MARTITIVAHDGNNFDVHEGEQYVAHLTWDEMLGQIAHMTHPEIARPRYTMETPEQLEARKARWAAHRVPVFDAD